MLTIDDADIRRGTFHANDEASASKYELNIGLLRYWRDALIDGSMLGNSRRKGEHVLKEGTLQTGRVGDKLTKAFMGDPKQTRRQRDVLVAVGRLVPKVSHAHRYGALYGIAPLWIPAVLFDTGELHPHRKHHPFLAREVLAPSTQRYPVIAELEDVDAFYAGHLDGAGWSSQWASAVTWAFALWEHAVGEAFSTFKHQSADLNFEALSLYPADENLISRKSILAIDCAIDRLSNGKALPLLDALTLAKPPDIRSTIASLRHTGHLASNPLGDDQRLALEYALTIPEGGIQAINGPPGTGKTTLLLDLFASLVTSAACSSEDALAPTPPLIAVASTNNTAVTNVLDALNELRDDMPFGQRWLSRPPGYGVYFLADVKQAKHYDYLTRDCSGLLRNVHEIAVEEHERAYLAAYEATIGEKCADVTKAVHVLHLMLRREHETLLHTLDARKRYASLIPQGKTPVFAREQIRDRHRETIFALGAEADSAEENLRRLEDMSTALEMKLASAARALESNAWYEDLFSWLDGVRRRRIRRALDILGEKSSEADFSVSISEMRLRIERRRSETVTALDAERKRTRQTRERHEAALCEETSELSRFDAAIAAWVQYASSYSLQRDVLLCDPEQAEALFDREERAQAFRLAMRYWEGRWILEQRLHMRSEWGERNFWKAQKRRDVLARLRHIAMIAPIAVMTLHELPKRYDFYDDVPIPLFEELDMLVIDEAGQVAVEVALPAMLHAKRVVCVGDVHQLEPIVACGRGLSCANFRARIPERLLTWDDACDRGLVSYQNGNGSVMRAAQQCTTFSAGSAKMLPGATLTKHFRCVPEIIRFSRDLLYPYLEPKREPLRDALFPPMAYYHVRGAPKKVHGSRVNEAEARLIAEFLVRNCERLRTAYPEARNLADIVGIITPFTAQTDCIAACIAEAFKAASLGEEDAIPIGTVYSFQGGQKRIIVYSHVYGPDEVPAYVDRKVNLLNVATTRAQDHFVVFADMAALSASPSSSPSGKLARLLLEHDLNRLDDLPVGYYEALLCELEHFTTPEQHHRLLDEALTQAQRRVFIVSPFLSNVGVRWYMISKIHAKTLAIDDCALYEGSFNWLSASPDAKKRAHECGWLVRGTKAMSAIAEVLSYYERRADEIRMLNLPSPSG